MGSDPEIGLGFVYNALPTDTQYPVPPALGYDFFQGPIVADRGDEDGDGVDDDGNSDPDTLQATAISYFNNGAAGQHDD